MNINEFLEKNKSLVLAISFLAIGLSFILIVLAFRTPLPKPTLDQKIINQVMEKTINSQRANSSSSTQAPNGSTALIINNKESEFNDKTLLIAIGAGVILLVIISPLVLLKRR